jgi:hypothetical protein
MQLNDFLSLSLGSAIYNKKTKEIRRTTTALQPDRLEQYKASGAVMWTRPLFSRNGWGLDIPLSDCEDWEPLPMNVWEIDDQEVINRYIILQQRHIIDMISDSYGNI